MVAICYQIFIEYIIQKLYPLNVYDLLFTNYKIIHMVKLNFISILLNKKYFFSVLLYQ